MAKGPSKADYAASPTEQAASQVATSQYNDWKQKYRPLLVKRSVDSQNDSIKTNIRGRANADTMQKLSPAAGTLRGAESTTIAGDMAEAVTGQLGTANKAARKYQNDVGVDTLSKARQLGGTASEGLAQAARLGVSSQLAKAQAKQEVAQSKLNAGVSLLATGIPQMVENHGQTGNVFTPGIADGVNKETGEATYKAAKGIGEYWTAGTKRNF